MKFHRRTDRAHPRQGSIVPAIAFALLVVMLGLALVVDRMWIDSAQVELTRAAEAAALAAARELVTDDLLRAETSPLARLAAAQAAAVQAAGRNTVAGNALSLSLNEDDPDVRVGRSVWHAESNTSVFLDTMHAPDTVVVSPRLDRAHGNPLATLFRHAGSYAADLAVIAEARVDNRVVGLRPVAGTAVPALPLAILADDPQEQRSDTWQAQILQQLGRDDYGYDLQADAVTHVPDGIPEIILRIAGPAGTDLPPNVRLIDLGGAGDRTDQLARQIERGWSRDDLADLGGEFRLNDDLLLPGEAIRSSGDLDALAAAQGKVRICLLFRELPATAGGSAGGAAGASAPGANQTMQIVGLVAGRILALRAAADNTAEIVFQPAVIVTHTAIVDTTAPAAPDEDNAAHDSSASAADGRNAYIYKLSLIQSEK